MKLSEENSKRASNQKYKYRGSRAGYRGIEEDKLIAIGKAPSVTSIDPDTLWVEGQLNKNGEIDNPTTQEAIDRLNSQDLDSNALLSKALNRPEHSSRLLGVGLGVSRKTFLRPQKRARREDIVMLEKKLNYVLEKLHAMENNKGQNNDQVKDQEKDQNKDQDEDQNKDQDEDQNKEQVENQPNISCPDPSVKDSCTFATHNMPEVFANLLISYFTSSTVRT
ncbi:hypothetical protein RIF29_25937 [Crotalaria pallida]|uniref:Uncharacterized protein n=1 Tax=Crotalaria pallida TaxID=3830 RepID=A0AAN9I1E8_CROPI